MAFIEDFVLIIHVLVALAIVGLVLIQQGRGAEMGAGFGSGASATLFGSGGSTSFLTRLTTIIAAVYFVTSLSLAYIAKEKSTTVQQLGIPDVEQIEAAMPGELMQLDQEDQLLPVVRSEGATGELPRVSAEDDVAAPESQGLPQEDSSAGSTGDTP